MSSSSPCEPSELGVNSSCVGPEVHHAHFFDAILAMVVIAGALTVAIGFVWLLTVRCQGQHGDSSAATSATTCGIEVVGPQNLEQDEDAPEVVEDRA